MDHPVAVCTSTVSKKRKIVWELESLNLIPIILDEEILVIKVEAYPTFYQTYFYQLTWFWHLGYKISLSVMDALTVMLFLPRCNPLPRIWMMRSGAALAKSALTCIGISQSIYLAVSQFSQSDIKSAISTPSSPSRPAARQSRRRFASAFPRPCPWRPTTKRSWTRALTSSSASSPSRQTSKV